MKMDQEKCQEQERMDYVVDQIQKAEKKDKQNIQNAEADERAIQANFKNNVRIKTSTYSGMMDTALSVRQQQQLLQERENNWKSATRELAVLEKLEKKPYFARIDFQEAGESKPESIYIGLASFSDTPDHFLVYDWRAPISSVYYDGGLGKVTYDTPDGPQTVDLKLKRQFMVEDGKIISMFDTDETVGDQMLLEVLDESSDIKMKSIVTTIQKEQNKIIRDTQSDLLFVQGAAGSGKTSAVLQRVAYLLYRYRGNLNSSQIILFSPNQLFNDYIDRVLPELGEQNMVQMTFYQYTQRRVPRLHVETLQERFEENNQGANKRIKTLKDSLAFFNATTKYAAFLEKGGMDFKDIKYQGKVVFSKEKIREIYYGFNENYHLRNRLSATKEELLKLLHRRLNKTAKMDKVQKAVQDLSQEELNQLYGNKNRDSFESGEDEMFYLAKNYVMKHFQKIRQTIIHNRFININRQYYDFLKAVPQLMKLDKYQITADEWQTHTEKVKQELIKRQLSMTNTTAYLYLYDLITGKRGNNDIKHVFIDEIQDYTAYQLAYLKTDFPRAHFTMLGDLNQAIFTKENSHSLLNELSTMFDPEKTKVVQLTQSYRSTKQITDFTKGVLVNGEKVTAFNRNGDLPTITVDSENAKMVDDVVTQLHRNAADHMTTAIIGKSLAECAELTDQLKARGEQATLIKTENQRLVEGTLVIPAYLAKGLEFDAIIMWNANDTNYHDEDERQLVYTICSRAMHRLDIFAEGRLSRLFANVDPATYKLNVRN